MEGKARRLLVDAEKRFGGSDRSWKLVGIGVHEDGPRIWFPSPADKLVTIQLHASSEDQALYQLAHEVVHLLAPNRAPPTIMFEEGLAVLFSLTSVRFSAPGYLAETRASMMTNYKDAYDLANEVITAMPGIVRRLRENRQNFYEWDERFLVEAGIAQPLAARMCERRQMR
jgi:hypothetical protein